MSMERLIFCAPILGICALLFAFYLTKKVGGHTSVDHRLRSRNRVVLIRIYGDHLRAVVIILIPSLYRYLQEELFG